MLTNASNYQNFQISQILPKFENLYKIPGETSRLCYIIFPKYSPAEKPDF